jgi:CheY-like chemotaxis protein
MRAKVDLNYRIMAHQLQFLPRSHFAKDRGRIMWERSGKHHRVLVVDDNEDAATSLAILMTQVGYEVKTAFNGKAALEIAWQFDPDVCILDINMPGMSGYDLARRLREIPRGHAPVLATMTAYNDLKHLDSAADAGFDLHFTKPVELNDLVDQIEDSLQQHEH